MIWFVSLVRCVGVRLLFCISQVTMARLLCWSAPGVGGGGVVAGLNTWRCWWWFVSVLGGGGGADCWTGRRDDTDMDNRPAGEVRLGGGSDEEWRESCVITCIYRNSPWTCIGDPLYSNKSPNPPVIMCFSSCIYHLNRYYISGTCISGGKTRSGKSSWRSGKWSGIYFYLSGWPFQGLESPYLSLHRLLDMQAAHGGEYRTRLVNEIVFFFCCRRLRRGCGGYLGELNEFSKILNYRPQ